ncbi:unnamed protein product, partial [Allacma fusca]
DNLKSKIVPIFSDATEAAYNYVGNLGSTYLFLTNKDAPNYKLITANINATSSKLNQSEGTQWSHVSLVSTFLEEHPKNVVNFAGIVDEYV